MNEMLLNIFVNIVTSLNSQPSIGASGVLQALYSFIHVQNKLPTSSSILLQSNGLLVVGQDGNFVLVHEKSYLFQHLCQVAQQNHQLFSQFDLGGAEELQFSDSCHQGQISAKCLGSCFTITGRTKKERNLTITCNDFLIQHDIVQSVGVSLSVPTCVMIKLARNHPAIDFVIYESKGQECYILFKFQAANINIELRN